MYNVVVWASILNNINQIQEDDWWFEARMHFLANFTSNTIVIVIVICI